MPHDVEAPQHTNFASSFVVCILEQHPPNCILVSLFVCLCQDGGDGKNTRGMAWGCPVEAQLVQQLVRVCSRETPLLYET